MWIFTRYGFYSIACADAAGGGVDPHTLMIRARRRAHLEKLQARFASLGHTQIKVTPGRDYRYRIVVPKQVWVGIVSELAQEQEWSNFKNEAERYQSTPGTDYAHALHEVWSTMHRFQEKEKDRPGTAGS
jgi:hypothetical protein